MFRCGVRVGAAAFVVGFSVVGPQAVAAADGGSADSSAGRAGNSSSSSTSRSDSSPAVRTSHRGARSTGRSASPVDDSASAELNDAAPAPAAALTIPAARNRAVGRVATADQTQTPFPLPSAAVAPVVSAAAEVPASVISRVRQSAPPVLPSAAEVVTSAPAGSVQAFISSAVNAGLEPEPEPIDSDQPIGPIEKVGISIVTAVQRIDSAIYGGLDAAANWLATLPSTPVTEFLQGTLLLVRRNVFNQAPTLNPVQTTGQLVGPITGTVGAVDPESEAMTYRLVQAPKEGTVTVNADGTYSYTPGLRFDGSDAFVVAADDQAKGLIKDNVLQPRRPAGTDALVTVKQGAPKVVTYTFTYATYAKGAGNAKAIWDLNPEALPALQWAAFQLADTVDPQYSVTLNYRLGIASGADALANAGSPSVNEKDPGFYMTLVQNRIVKGTNPTGATTDGEVNFNFSPAYSDTKFKKLSRRATWAYYGDAGPTQFSFQSTATHEVLHSFGMVGAVQAPGCNEFTCDDKGKPTTTPKTNWGYYDQFLGDSDKIDAIDKATNRWDPLFDDNLIGGKEDGLYFLGQKAVEEFGGPVPMFSPDPFDPGSSVVHLADYFFNDTDPASKYYVKLMNAAGSVGEKNLPLSAVEIAILKDLGYKMKA